MDYRMKEGLPLNGSVGWHNGRPTLFINDHPQYPMIYALTDCPGGRWSWDEVPAWNIKNFTNQGFKLFHVSIWLEHLWNEDGSFSIELARKQIRGIVDICPDAAIFFRLHINSPKWWNRLHPEECVQYANGPLEEDNDPGLRRLIDKDLDRVPRHSMASLKWKNETSDIIKRLCAELSMVPEGDYLAGIHVSSGVYHEWHYWGFIDNEPDTSVPMTLYFRKWLLDKYGSDEALQTAWNDRSVTAQNALVPGMEPRMKTLDGIFRDPVHERPVCDYYECQQQSVADNIIHFCSLIKEFWPRPLVTGVFYGYFFSLFGRHAAGGHLQVEKVLNSPAIDYLSAPQAYWRSHREMGGSGQSRGILESCYLHGKLCLDEIDTGTFLDVIRKTELANTNTTLADSIAIIRRNAAQSFTRGMGLWFYDFGPANVSGWWDHVTLMEDIGKIKALFGKYYSNEYKPQADVLYVYDTNSFYYLANNSTSDPVTDPAVVNAASGEAYHSGAALDMIYLCDLPKADLDRYRVVVFANTWLLTTEQKEFIKTKVAGNGRHLVWMCAPGYTDGNRNDHRFVSEVTGINVERIEVTASLSICLCASSIHDDPASSVVCEQPANMEFGEVKPYSPLFGITDDKAQTLGYLKNTSCVALAKKELGDSTSWYCSLPLQSSVLLRTIFHSAGAHIYNNDGDVIYSGSGILSIHTATGGSRTITLRNGKSFTKNLQPRSTTFFDNTTGIRLL